MREANFWIISCRFIVSRGNPSGSSFLSTHYQFAYLGNSVLLFRKIPPGLLRFPTNKTKTLRNHQSFHYVTSWKKFEKYIKQCEMLLQRLRSRSWKHGKIFICFQRKCYKKVKISCLFFITWFIQCLIW